MDDHAPGWLPDPDPGPEHEGQERYWNGTGWTDRVRPAARARSLHLPEHVPELQRALAAATADIDAVEDHLSDLFDRTDGPATTGAGDRAATRVVPPPEDDRDEALDLGLADEVAPDDEPAVDDEPAHAELDDGDDDGDFAELDAALATEEPERVPEFGRKGLFRRRS